MQAIPPSQAEILLNDRKYVGELRKGSSPLWLILQGLLVIGVGIYFIVISSSSPYKEITGNILSITDTTNANGSYSNSYLQISTDPNDIYVFNKSQLTTAWSSPSTKGARVDVYYNSNDMSKIVALQMYDLAGHPTAQYTTNEYANGYGINEYTNILNPSPFKNTGVDIGLVLLLLGVIWAGLGINRVVRHRNNM